MARMKLADVLKDQHRTITELLASEVRLKQQLDLAHERLAAAIQLLREHERAYLQTPAGELATATRNAIAEHAKEPSP